MLGAVHVCTGWRSDADSTPWCIVDWSVIWSPLSPPPLSSWLFSLFTSVSPPQTSPIAALPVLLTFSSTGCTLRWKYVCNAAVWRALSMMPVVVNAAFLVLTPGPQGRPIKYGCWSGWDISLPGDQGCDRCEHPASPCLYWLVVAAGNDEAGWLHSPTPTPQKKKVKAWLSLIHSV